MKKHTCRSKSILLSLLLILCMVFACSIPAGAAGISFQVMGSAQLLDCVSRADSTDVIRLGCNITNIDTPLVIPAGRTVTIDLNGFYLSGKQTYYTYPGTTRTVWIDKLMENKPLLVVEKGASLNLISTNSTTGEIENHCKGGIAVENFGTFTMKDVTLTTDAKDSVSLINHGTFNMQSGTIISKGQDGYGVKNDGSFVFNGGTLTQREGNNAVAFLNTGNLTINQMSSNCTGQGVTVFLNKGAAVMNGGYIAASGNGVCCLNNQGSFTKSGGTLLATGLSSLTVTGNPIIENQGIQVDPNNTIGVRPTVSASPTNATVIIDGTAVAFDAYNIDGNNYFKLRDVAYAFNGSPKAFSVTWDQENGIIRLDAGLQYTPVGGEMAPKSTVSARAALSTHSVSLNLQPIALTAYNIDGNNYFKLRDLGNALDFGITWDGAARRIIIDTSASYVAE